MGTLENLKSHVHILAEEIGIRSILEPEKLDRAALYIGRPLGSHLRIKLPPPPTPTENGYGGQDGGQAEDELWRT